MPLNVLLNCGLRCKQWMSFITVMW